MPTLIYHKNLASGNWQRLSLVKQMANIGSEVSRALRWQKKDQKLFQGAVDRAFELPDLTITDLRWQKQKRLKELVRVREVLGDALLGGKEYQSSLEDLERYFFYFALAIRLKSNEKRSR